MCRLRRWLPRLCTGSGRSVPPSVWTNAAYSRAPLLPAASHLALLARDAARRLRCAPAAAPAAFCLLPPFLRRCNSFHSFSFLHVRGSTTAAYWHALPICLAARLPRAWIWCMWFLPSGSCPSATLPFTPFCAFPCGRSPACAFALLARAGIRGRLLPTRCVRHCTCCFYRLMPSATSFTYRAELGCRVPPLIATTRVILLPPSIVIIGDIRGMFMDVPSRQRTSPSLL